MGQEIVNAADLHHKLEYHHPVHGQMSVSRVVGQVVGKIFRPDISFEQKRSISEKVVKRGLAPTLDRLAELNSSYREKVEFYYWLYGVGEKDISRKND